MSHLPPPSHIANASLADRRAGVSGTTTITTPTRGFRAWTVVQA
jgi:hypothetical protein